MSRYVRVSLWNVMNHSQNVTLKKASILDGWINQEGGFCVVMSRLPKIHRPIQYKDISASSMRVTNDQQGILEGLANKTGNIDYQDDRTCYGAWRKALQEAYARKAQQNLDYIVPYLFNHDFRSLPPGGVVDADALRDGLHIKVQLNMDIPAGRDVFYSFKNGTLRKQSVGYRTIKCDYVKENGRTIRELKELALLECSCVVFPANDLAAVTSVKGRNEYNDMLRSKDFNSTYQSASVDDWFGVELGFSGSASSGMDMVGMMSMSGAGIEGKAGYINARNHSAAIVAADAIMKHAKTLKSALSSVGSGARRYNESVGQPLYSRASAPSDYFEEKEDEEGQRALLRTMATRMEVDNALRESKQDLASVDPLDATMRDINATLARLMASHGE